LAKKFSGKMALIKKWRKN